MCIKKSTSDAISWSPMEMQTMCMCEKAEAAGLSFQVQLWQSPHGLPDTTSNSQHFCLCEKNLTSDSTQKSLKDFRAEGANFLSSTHGEMY